MNIFILANVPNDSANVEFSCQRLRGWRARTWGSLAVADYLDGANVVGCSCQHSQRVWMARTCGSLASANVPNDYRTNVDSVAIART